MNTLDFRKRAIMSTLGNVEKTVKVEGDKTIKFSNDTDYKITNFKLYGWTNEIGEGEKSPDNPYTFEHYENPSITVRGSNLLDKSTIFYSSDAWTETDTGFKCSSENTGDISWQIDIKPNTTYYIRWNRICRTASGRMYFFRPGCSDDIGSINVGNIGETNRFYCNTDSTGLVSGTFTTPEKPMITKIVISAYGFARNEDIEGYNSSETYYMELKDIWLGTEPFEKYEPYKEPKTIQLSDVVLRGLLSNTKADTLYTNSIYWKGYAIDDKAYWSDSLQYDNGKVCLSEEVKEVIATDYAHSGDLVYDAENNANICQPFILKGKVLGQPKEDYAVNNWFSVKTYFIPSDYTTAQVPMASQRCTHFKTAINDFWSMATYDKYKNCFSTGGVRGSWSSLYGHSVSKSVATTKDEIATYMRNLWNTQEVHYMMPYNTTEKDIGDTNSTALKQLLSQSFSGTTIIETNGYIKAEFKYKE